MNKNNTFFAISLVALFAVVFGITVFVQYLFSPIDKETHKELYGDTAKKIAALYFGSHCLDVVGDIDDQKPLTHYTVDTVNECYEEMNEAKDQS